MDGNHGTPGASGSRGLRGPKGDVGLVGPQGKSSETKMFLTSSEGFDFIYQDPRVLLVKMVKTVLLRHVFMA